MATFKKFVRPDAPARAITSSRDLDLIEAVLCYRFSPTSELVRLVGGNQDVTQRRLRMLWTRDILNRFAFPKIPNQGEFIYYIDAKKTLELLVDYQRLSMIHPQMEDELRMNREADYAGAAAAGQHMKLGFLKHSLMISRLHFMLEMASRSSNGEVALTQWRQGAELRGNKVQVPELTSKRIAGSNEYRWEESDRTFRLPVEPDALFTLRFARRPKDNQLVHFCYEADRGSMPMADMLKKFRAYHHFIKRQQKHKEAFGVHPIRAVLVETTDEARARKLMELAEHPGVIGQGKRSAMFWFIISPVFTSASQGSFDKGIAGYLDWPSVIFGLSWALPDGTLHAMRDAENS
jgi:hypothetical protein